MTNVKDVCLIVVALTLLALPSSVVWAQASDAIDCEAAAKVISRGRASNTEGWAAPALQKCGAMGARAFAQGLNHYVAVSDVIVLREFMSFVDQWRDASILQTATQIATNPSASLQARVFAVRHLITLLQPQHVYTYAGLTKGVDTTRTADLVVWTPGCGAQITSGRWGTLAGALLPAGFEASVRATLQSIASSGAAPRALRNAARCVDQAK